MGVSFIPIPLSEIINTEGGLTWLQTASITNFPPTDNSRWPTPLELRQVLDKLNGYAVQYAVSDKHWDAYIMDAEIDGNKRGTDIWVRDFCGKEDVPHGFTFHKGDSKLAVRIIEKLSAICGPFIIVLSDSYEMPVLVTPGIDIEEADRKLWGEG